MEKKNYKKPMTKIVELKQQHQLLAGSVAGARQSYGEVIEL